MSRNATYNRRRATHERLYADLPFNAQFLAPELAGFEEHLKTLGFTILPRGAFQLLNAKAPPSHPAYAAPFTLYHSALNAVIWTPEVAAEFRKWKGLSNV